MNKNITDLNISEENKILLSKIEKRISVLAKSSQEYFEASLFISSDSTKEAYSNNENLIQILETNDSKIEEIKSKSYLIRESHQTDFTKEVILNTEELMTSINLIQNTLDNKDELIDSNKKMFVLNKRIKFLQKRTSQRKIEMEESISNLEKDIENKNLLNLTPVKEDLDLIKSFINPKKISKTRFINIIPFLIFIVSILTLMEAI